MTNTDNEIYEKKFWVWFELAGRGWCIAEEGERHFQGAKLVRLVDGGPTPPGEGE